MYKVLCLVVLLLLVMLPVQAQQVISGFDPRCIEIDDVNFLASGANVLAPTNTSLPCYPVGMYCTSCIDWLTKYNEVDPNDPTKRNIVGIIDGIGNNDADILSPGSTLSAGSTLPKQDITRVWISNNREYLYIGEERRANNGTSAYHLLMTKISPTHIFGQPVRVDLSAKDIVITICFPNASQLIDKDGNVTATIEVWQVPVGTNPPQVEIANIFDSTFFFANFAQVPAAAAFSINLAPTTAIPGAVDSKGDPATNYDTACFAEAAMSLAQLGLNPCGSTAYATVVTRSSCTLTSDVKDIAGPVLYSFGGPTVTVNQPVIDCDNTGCVTATASAGLPPYSYKWYDNNVLIPNQSTNQLCKEFSVGNHIIKVEVTDANQCTVDASTTQFTVYAKLDVTLAGTATCPGAVTWTATPSGGDSNYTYAWKVDGVAVSNTTATYNYAVKADCNDHTVCVTVTDGRTFTDGHKCTKEACKKINQVVTTTISNP